MPGFPLRIALENASAEIEHTNKELLRVEHSILALIKDEKINDAVQSLQGIDLIGQTLADLAVFVAKVSAGIPTEIMKDPDDLRAELKLTKSKSRLLDYSSALAHAQGEKPASNVELF